MRESLIEEAGVEYAEARGWAVYKWSSPGTKGVHDRLHFKNGLAFSIEYKATGERATKLQRDVATQLKAAGIPSRCIDNVTDARAFINLMDKAAKGKSGDGLLTMVADDIGSFTP